MQLSLGYITAPNLAEARRIVTALLEEKLIACANIIPGAESHFVWKNELHKESEILIIIKTRTKNEEKIIQIARELHSYKCPCIEFIDIAGGDSEFLKWVDKSC